MRGYIVGYTACWGDMANPKIVGQFSNWKTAVSEAKKLIRPLITVYIIESEVNKSIIPISDENCWIHDFKHFIVYKDHLEKRLPVREDKN